MASNTNDAINGIAAWLGRQLATANVRARADANRDVVLFRIEPGDGSAERELEISGEALDDQTPETIIADLSRQEVPQRLSRDATMRLAYTTDREVPHFETRLVICDGRNYRIVRGDDHTVRIFASTGRLLEQTPSPLSVLETSIFRGPPERWWDDIRAWRGLSQ